MAVVSDFLQDMKLETPKDALVCLGRRFRCRVTTFVSAAGEIVEKVTYKPLKKLSCQGCARCGWMDEVMGEIESGWLVLPSEPEDRAVYELVVLEESTDWETGIVDDMVTGLRKVVA